jgi:membrane protein
MKKSRDLGLEMVLPASFRRYASNVTLRLNQNPQSGLARTIGVITGVLRDFERKHLSLVAAGLAFNFLMSLLPALLLLTSLAAYLPLQNGAHGLISFLSPVIPEQSIALIAQLLNRIGSHRAGLLSIAVITTLWLTSVATKSVIAGLDIVFEVAEPRRVWTNRILAVVLTLAVGILLVAGLLITLIGPVVERALSIAAPAQSTWVQIWPFAHWALPALFTFAAIELLYLFAPNIHSSIRGTIPGALVAALGLLILAWVLGWSFSNFGGMKFGRSLEFLATPIAVAVWLHWSATIVLLGAEINLNITRKIMTGGTKS